MSSSVSVSDAPVTVIVSELAAAWLFAAVPVTVTERLLTLSTSSFTAAIAAVSVLAVEPAAMTIVTSGPTV